MQLPALIYDVVNKENNGDIIVICKNEEEAYNSYNLAKFFNPKINAFYFPAWDTIPYDRVSPSRHIMTQRVKTLSLLGKTHGKNIIFCTSISLLQKIPPKKALENKCFEVIVGNKIKITDITNYLANNGFIRTNSAIEPSEFAQKGEILDIVVSENAAYRLTFEWDTLVKIRILDPISQISSSAIEKFDIYPSSEMILSKENIENFKSEFLKLFTVNQLNNPIYLAITEGRSISGSEQLISLAYPNMENLLDYTNNTKFIYNDIINQILEEEFLQIEDFYEARKSNNQVNPNQFYPLFQISKFYFDYTDIQEIIKKIDYH
jgi:transcription-repair coupling factor (superfamily II helicase)